MKDMKLSNIQKESERIKIKKIINECEDLKAQVLLNLGIMTFDKIRKGEIIDKDFDTLCEKIKNLDIEIYTKYMQLRNFENESKKTTCQCGYVAFKNEKFCPQCGKSLIEEKKSYITCHNCNQETEKGSNFCACCGNKIKQECTHYDDEVYCDNEDVNIEEPALIDIPEVDMLEENDSKEFLKQQEELAIENDDFEEDIEVNKKNIEDDFIEIQGREFLKSHQDHIKE